MDWRKFEDICRKSRLIPAKKVTVKEADVYIADGYFNTHPEYDKPHYKTVWMVARDGGDIARPLYFDFGKNSKEGRINAALEDAKKFIELNVERGRYV